MLSNGEPYIFTDCGVIINPTEQELADIALDAAETALHFGIEPNVAMLSFSTKGSAKSEGVDKVVRATKLAQEALLTERYKDRGIQIDGELQADAALNSVVAAKKPRTARLPAKPAFWFFRIWKPEISAIKCCNA